MKITKQGLMAGHADPVFFFCHGHLNCKQHLEIKIWPARHEHLARHVSCTQIQKLSTSALLWTPNFFHPKRLRHFCLRDIFSRSSWWSGLGYFSLRSRVNCWVTSSFRGSRGWSSIPIYHLLGSHTMQPVNQIASDVTRKHGKKQHDKSDDLSTVHPNLSSIVEVHFFYSKSGDFMG